MSEDFAGTNEVDVDDGAVEQPKGKLFEAPILLDGEKAGEDIFVPEEPEEGDEPNEELHDLLTRAKIQPTGDERADWMALARHNQGLSNDAFHRARVLERAQKETQAALAQAQAQLAEFGPIFQEYKAYQAAKAEREWQAQLPDPNADPAGYARAVAAREAERAVAANNAATLKAQQEQQEQEANRIPPEKLQEHYNATQQWHAWGVENDPVYPAAYERAGEMFALVGRQQGVPEHQLGDYVRLELAKLQVTASLNNQSAVEVTKDWVAYNDPSFMHRFQQQAQPTPVPRPPARGANFGARPSTPARQPQPSSRNTDALVGGDFWDFAEARANGQVTEADVKRRVLR